MTKAASADQRRKAGSLRLLHSGSEDGEAWVEKFSKAQQQVEVTCFATVVNRS